MGFNNNTHTQKRRYKKRVNKWNVMIMKKQHTKHTCEPSEIARNA